MNNLLVTLKCYWKPEAEQLINMKGLHQEEQKKKKDAAVNPWYPFLKAKKPHAGSWVCGEMGTVLPLQINTV